MRVTKLFYSVLMVLVISVSSYANTTPEEKALSTQINQIIKTSPDIANLNESTTVNFLINSDNEIIVVSTSSKDSDLLIRAILNQKKINIKNVQVNKMYTLPIRVK